MATHKFTKFAAKYPPVTGSSFWRKKMAALFRSYDVNNDGFLTIEDFEEMGDTMISLNGLTGDSAKKVKGMFQDIWTNYHSSPSSSKIHFDDFLARRLVDVNGFMREDIGDSTQATFDAVDINGDGAISIQEYLNVAEIYRMGEATGRMIFHIMDKNDDGEITVDELQEAAHDFFFNEDPSSPYKLLWGPLPKV